MARVAARVSAYVTDTANRLAVQLAAGQPPWEGFVPGSPEDLQSGRRSHGVNRLRLLLAPVRDPRWMTSEDARLAGLSPSEGQRPTTVLTYHGNKIKSEQVFNASQLNAPNYLLAPPDYQEVRRRLENVILSLKIPTAIEMKADTFSIHRNQIVFPRPAAYGAEVMVEELMRAIVQHQLPEGATETERALAVELGTLFLRAEYGLHESQRRGASLDDASTVLVRQALQRSPSFLMRAIALADSTEQRILAADRHRQSEEAAKDLGEQRAAEDRVPLVAAYNIMALRERLGLESLPEVGENRRLSREAVEETIIAAKAADELTGQPDALLQALESIQTFHRAGFQVLDSASLEQVFGPDGKPGETAAHLACFRLQAQLVEETYRAELQGALQVWSPRLVRPLLQGRPAIEVSAPAGKPLEVGDEDPTLEGAPALPPHSAMTHADALKVLTGDSLDPFETKVGADIASLVELANAARSEKGLALAYATIEAALDEGVVGGDLVIPPPDPAFSTLEGPSANLFEQHKELLMKQMQQRREIQLRKDVPLKVPAVDREEVLRRGAAQRSSGELFVPAGRDLTPFQIWLDRQQKASRANRTYLKVPYRERLEAKGLGALFDGVNKTWYVPNGVDSKPFDKWRREPSQTAEPSVRPEVEFGQFLRDQGFLLKSEPIADGKWRQCPVAGHKNNRKVGSYLLFSDSPVRGLYRDFRTHDQAQTWTPTQVSTREKISPEEVARKRAEANRVLQEKREASKAAAADHLRRLHNRAGDASKNEYLRSKRLELPAGAFIDAGKHPNLVIPLYSGPLSAPEVAGVQTITAKPLGDSGYLKRFQEGMSLDGCYAVIGGTERLKRARSFVVCEGWATGASIDAACRKPEVAVLCAMTASNLKAVALLAAEKGSVLVAADNDRGLEHLDKPLANEGIKKAKAAAKAANGVAVEPKFPGLDPTKSFDFSDVYLRVDPKAVARQVAAGFRALARKKTRDRARRTRDHVQEKGR